MKSVCAALLLAISQASAGSEAYVCISDQFAGFIYDTGTKQWKASSGPKGNVKYLVRARSDSDSPLGVEGQSRFLVFEFGSEEPVFWCREGFDRHGALRCGKAGAFRMNKKTQRFIGAFTLGYWHEGHPELDDGNEGKHVPHMIIGRCSPL